ncbi:hypothetical protein [Paenibacillus polymyxa]|nr:hypothetical protein [Paenibacillus polymyxa]
MSESEPVIVKKHPSKFTGIENHFDQGVAKPTATRRVWHYISRGAIHQII